ncbi:MAG: sensor histidine kinase, partial [Chitinophagaceae bacterium]
MNPQLQSILEFIQQNENLPAEKKNELIKAIKKADQDLTISAFKLERTEKVKRTTAILLEETIEELEQKRKAVEAQNRELEIESALERVRTVAMGMKKPDDLLGICKIMFNELQVLGFDELRNALIHTFSDERKYFNNYDYSDFTGGTVSNIPYSGHPVIEKFIKQLRQDNIAFSEIKVSGKELEEWKEFRKANNEADDPRLDNIKELYYYNYPVGSAGIGISTYNSITEEKLNILKRFRNVFDLAYKRYVDITLAEAQAREAQIELGLERVRARAMAMQKSGELKELIGTVFIELTKLDLVLTRCLIMIYDPESNGSTWWMANSEAPTDPIGLFIKYHQLPPYAAFIKSWKERKNKWQYVLEGTDKKEWDDFLFVETELSQLPDFVIAGMKAPDRVYLSASFNNFGCLNLASLEPLSDEHFDILLRFAKVFDLTYTRFNDLQKAEGQAREAQIEAALERVRSRTMAMQRSEELAEVATVLFQQVKALGVPQWTCGFSIFEIDDKEFTWYPGSADGDILPPVKIPLTEHPVFISFNESRKRGDEFFAYEKEGEYQAGHYRYMQSLPGVGEMLQRMLDAGLSLPTFQIDHLANFSHGNLVFITFEPVPEMHDVFKRFAKVFEQTYTRFLDLQKAEAQAREAQIEAALERVRSRSMGMQKSEELREVGNEIYKQLVQLNFDVEGDGFMLDYPGTDDWYAWGSDRWGAAPDQIHYPYINHPYWNRYKEAKEKGMDFFATNLTFEEKNTLFDHFFKYLPAYTPEVKKVIYASPGMATAHVFLKNVVLYVWNISGTPYTVAENAIILRFGKVFEQAYIRFIDLKNAEAQALAAIKRASVDRVRAEIASMRTTSDLERIQPLIWNELKTLGVPFIRCGVFIMDEEKQELQTMLSTPEGKAIATLHVPFEFDLAIITNGVQYWRKKEVYKEHWDADAFTNNWIKLASLRETSMDSPQAEHPPESLYLHMLPFLQGMLYVGNIASLKEDELQLVQNLADAFSTAYARYEDFNKLEAAKKQVDSTLNELQVTQKQLIQSEKMASLGELTAGIAHEIQNPLNFVNNFSEVSKELLDEMKEAIEKGDAEEAREIMNDVIQNLEKINHHGKRADGIVKGMLQHSRSSSGGKEPTDINALADEYLRLAYHGLRARDKSFNAILK